MQTTNLDNFGQKKCNLKGLFSWFAKYHYELNERTKLMSVYWFIQTKLEYVLKWVYTV